MKAAAAAAMSEGKRRLCESSRKCASRVAKRMINNMETGRCAHSEWRPYFSTCDWPKDAAPDLARRLDELSIALKDATS